MLADQGQVVDELAEHEHLVAVFEQAIEQVREHGQLAALEAQFGRHQGRVAAGAAQPHHFGQDLDRLLALGRFQRGELLERLAPQRLVQRRLFLRQFDRQHDLGARWQFGQYLGLGAAQDEGLDKAPQPGARTDLRALVLGPFDRPGKAQVELVAGAQQAGIDEAEQVPQLAQVVFQRRAGGHHAEVALQGHHGLRALGGRVLDRLRFVEHDVVPADLGKHRCFELQQAIADDDEVERTGFVQHGGAVAAAEQLHVQGRREARRLADPVHAHRGGRHHQRWPLGGA